MAGIDLTLLRTYESQMAVRIPGFKVKFKDESFLMKVLGFLAHPFNPDFLSTYTTTLGKTVYFPSRVYYESNPAGSMKTLFHEGVHLWDEQQHPLTFKASYLFPQGIGVFPLIVFLVFAGMHGWLVPAFFAGYALVAGLSHKTKVGAYVALATVVAGLGGLAIFLTGWDATLLLGVLAAVVPWPAPWRARWELRGYAADIAFEVWRTKSLRSQMLASIESHFTGPDYYFMSWSGVSVSAALRASLDAALSGDLQKEEPYSVTHDFLRQWNLLSL